MRDYSQLLNHAVAAAGVQDDRIDPGLLLVFLDVARAGSISAGARAMGWSQPAISAKIKTLEGMVGFPLLERTSNGVKPTKAGESLLRHCESLDAILSQATEEIKISRIRYSDIVQMAIFPTGLATIVPMAMTRLGSLDLNVRLTNADPATAMHLLRHGDVDIAILFQYPEDRIGTLDPQEGLSSRRITDEGVCVIVHAQHWAASQAGLRLADLADEQWVTGCMQCTQHLHTLAQESGFEPQIRYHIGDCLLVQSMVAGGLAIALVSRTLAEISRSPDVAIVHLPELRDRTIMAVYRNEGGSKGHRINAVLDALRP